MDAKLPGSSGPCPRPEEVLEIINEQLKTRDQFMSFSSFSPSLYDTAWLSLVPTETNPHGWLFPQCVELLLQAQQADGTWPSYACPTDGILTSLAALFSIVTHRARSLPLSEEHHTFTKSIEQGISGAQKLLDAWVPDGATNVGFELIAPALLRRFDQFAIQFDFPERYRLMQLYQEKMNKFSLEIVYGPEKTTLLHSIEAFFDTVQFTKISHHCSEELGIFGSPAATAAYLISSPEWDHRAERYLQRAVRSYGATGNVPCAFPTPLFEITWALSSMLSPVVESSSLANIKLSYSTLFLSETMRNQHGLVGFAPGILEDADDTARSLLTLMRLKDGTFPDVAPMVDKFEAGQCFKTYELERNSSFSANCNVVLTLLESGSKSIGRYGLQIEKTLSFLLDLADTADHPTIDKWNISPEYSSMLLVEVFVLALQRYDTGCLDTISHDIYTSRVPKTLCRTISQVLAAQQSDGSWGQSLEVTSYSILMLSHSLRLPWASSIRAYLAERLAQGQRFLAAEYPRAKQYDYRWIEKTTFQSSLLRMTYCSMALHTTVCLENWSGSITDAFNYIGSQSSRLKELFVMLPLLEHMQLSQVELVLVEAKFHTRSLASDRDSILPRGDLPLSKDKYLDYIPVIWLLCNQLNKQTLPPGVVGNMLKLSQLTFQIDEYMETTVARLSQAEVQILECWIESECQRMCALGQQNVKNHDEICQSSDGDEQCIDGNPDSAHGSQGLLSGVQTALGKFIQYVLRHKASLRSSPLIQRFLATELAQYLLAHLRQNADNTHLRSIHRDDSLAEVTDSSYFSWARNTGANHTSCPFAFRFFMCLISNAGPAQTNLESAQAQYFTSSVAQHLAAMCRQYNDYGSMERDAEEKNLNSIDFLEFQANSWNKKPPRPQPIFDDSSISSGRFVSARENLMAIAEFERQLMELSFRALKNVITPDMIAAIKVLIDVTDLFGQLYVTKDIASRKQRGERVRG